MDISLDELAKLLVAVAVIVLVIVALGFIAGELIRDALGAIL